MRHLEHTEQTKFVMRARCMYRDLVIFAVPNGGRRDTPEAVRLKAEGVLAGVPDIVVARAASGHHGLYLEFKTPTGRTSPKQQAIIAQLQAEGYCVEIVRSAEEAWTVLEGYLTHNIYE